MFDLSAIRHTVMVDRSAFEAAAGVAEMLKSTYYSRHLCAQCSMFVSGVITISLQISLTHCLGGKTVFGKA